MSDLCFFSRPSDSFTATGPEASKFLHSLLTQSVSDMKPGQGRWGAKTDRMAKMEAPFGLFRTEEGFFVLSDPGCLKTVLPKLKMFLFGAKVELLDRTEDLCILSLLGPESEAFLRTLGALIPDPNPLSHVETSCETVPVRLIRSEAFSGRGFDLVVSREEVSALQKVLEARGVTALDPSEAQARRVEAGRPVFGVDYEGDRMPTEIGLENAVSYNKGCYVGQEILERLRSRGKVTRVLRGLVLDGDPVSCADTGSDGDSAPEGESAPESGKGGDTSSGLPVLLGEKTIGTATSLVYSQALGKWIALASLKVADVEVDATVQVGAVSAQVKALPLVSDDPSGES